VWCTRYLPNDRPTCTCAALLVISLAASFDRQDLLSINFLSRTCTLCTHTQKNIKIYYYKKIYFFCFQKTYNITTGRIPTAYGVNAKCSYVSYLYFRIWLCYTTTDLQQLYVYIYIFSHRSSYYVYTCKLTDLKIQRFL
jgi:hypothetical protein